MTLIIKRLFKIGFLDDKKSAKELRKGNAKNKKFVNQIGKIALSKWKKLIK